MIRASRWAQFQGPIEVKPTLRLFHYQCLTTDTIVSLQRRGNHESPHRTGVVVYPWWALLNILKIVLSPTVPKGPQHAPGSHTRVLSSDWQSHVQCDSTLRASRWAQFQRPIEVKPTLSLVHYQYIITCLYHPSLQGRGNNESTHRTGIAVCPWCALSNILEIVLSPTFPKGPQHAPGSHKSTRQTGKDMFHATQR